MDMLQHALRFLKETLKSDTNVSCPTEDGGNNNLPGEVTTTQAKSYEKVEAVYLEIMWDFSIKIFSEKGEKGKRKYKTSRKQKYKKKKEEKVATKENFTKSNQENKCFVQESEKKKEIILKTRNKIGKELRTRGTCN